jgi:hypothetical protein
MMTVSSGMVSGVSGKGASSCRMQDAGCRMQDAGCRMQDARCKMQDAGCRMREALYNSLRRASTGPAAAAAAYLGLEENCYNSVTIL